MLNNRIDAVVRESSFGELAGMLDRARKAIRLADYAQAELLLKEAQQRRDRDAAEYFNLLGALHEAKNKRRLARKCYAKANALLNNYEPARFNLKRGGVGSARLGDEIEGVWFAKLP